MMVTLKDHLWQWKDGGRWSFVSAEWKNEDHGPGDWDRQVLRSWASWQD